MSITNEYFEQAQISMAAYASLQRGMFGEGYPGYVSSLVDFGMSQSQAEAFAATYAVIDQHTDPLSGFSATVFEKAGVQYLAVRGTETSGAGLVMDVIADVGVFEGLNGQQQYEQLKTYYNSLLNSGDIQSGNVHVTGHSLGGLLAQMLAVDYAGQINEAVTFNAPGMGGVGAEILDLLGVVESNIPVAQITNIRGEGLSPIASLGTLLGNVQEVFIEASLDPVHNHSIATLTDALAACALFGELSTTASMATLGDILRAATNQDDLTLETAVNALGDLFGAGVTITGNEEDVRNAFYSRIQAIQASAGYLAAQQVAEFVQVASLAGLGSEAVADQAQTDIAYRYALVNLIPFAITGDAALYTLHNANGELDLYDPLTREGDLTESYLDDRAEMLSLKIKYDSGVHDYNDLLFIGDKAYSDEWDSSTTPGDWHYVDYGTQINGAPLSLFVDGVGDSAFVTDPDHQVLFGSGDADALAGQDTSDKLYGGAGQDILYGNQGGDHLEGGRDDDLLVGGLGDDHLVGGQGSDTYVYRTGEGVDTIIDTDGAIHFDGVVLEGGAVSGADANTFVSDDGRFTYTRIETTSGTDVWINGAIKIQNYHPGDLGIVLGDPVEEPVQYLNVSLPDLIYPDRPELSYIPGSDGVPRAWSRYADFRRLHRPDSEFGIAMEGNGYASWPDEFGNYRWEFVSENIVAEVEDWNILTVGGSGGDRVTTGEGSDYVSTGPVRPFIDGVDSPDDVNLIGNTGWIYVPAEAGPDYVETGAGRDLAKTSGGDDTILLGSGQDAAAAGDGNDSIDGGEDGDLLSGGSGNDFMQGGSGNDLLYGDSYYSPYSPDVDIDWRVWDFSIDYSISNDGNHATFNANLFSVFEGTNTEPDGNDILYGGQGIDVIYGEGGDDILSGDDDVDSLTGGAGKDLLMGGVGDDWLWGDDGEDVTITGDDTLLGEAGVDHLYGGPGNDVLFGGADGDRLKGDDMLDSISVSGNDTLYGEGGDDELIGGPGDDYLDGGAGADSLFGDQDERFPGMVGNDILIGGAGDDYLDGGAGADVLYGGEGDDIYVVDDASDVIAENDAEGVDTVLVSFDYVLPNNIENIAILSSVMANATGDARANRLFGSEFTNTLEGLGGDDLLFGRAGDDVLNGGVGVDQLFGENGNDRLNGGVQNDTLYGGAGDDVFVATLGSGTDIIIDVEGINAVEFGAGITQDSLDLVQYQGDDGAYYLRVNYGASGDAIIIKNGPSGAIQSYRFNDGSSVTHEALMGQEPVPLLIDGTPYNDVIHGSAMADRVDAGLGDDQIYGAAGADTLMGGQGADTLDGGADNDTLDGGVGNDTLLGGAGEDRYVLQWGMGSDLVIEDGAALSTLELGYGVQLSDLDIWRDQNDLMVRFAGSTGGVRIQGYGASPLNWQIQDESGTAHALEDFVTQPPSTATPLDFEDVASGFVNTVRSNFIETLMQPGESTGYTMAADGVLRKVNSYVSDNYSATVHESANIVVEDVSTNSDAYVQDTQAYTNDYSYSQTSIRVATMTSMLGSTGGMSGYGAGTRSYHSFATNASYEIPSGAGVVTVYGPTVDQDGGQDVQLDGYTGEIGTQQPIGVWVFDNGAGTGIPTIVTHDISHRDDTLTLERVTGGAGNNAITVEGHAVVDGGSGDDSIVANAVRWEYSYANEFTPNPYGYTGQFDSRNHGALLFGNAGADQIAGGAANDLLIGGAGDDSIDGRMGEDVYVVRQGEGGYDIVADSGTFVRINYETGASRYADWYYQSLGIPDYVDRLLRGETIPPLPPLSPNDFDAMAQLAQSEVIETDTVEFAEGINLDQFTLTWGEVVLNSPVPPESQPWMDEQGMQFRTLDISWAEGEGVRIVIPHTYVSPPPYEDDVPLGVIGSFTYDRSDESLGLGIEQFRFADGTVLSMEQMVALAPAMPSLDPYLAVGDLTLIGTAGDDVLTGQEGNDILDGDAGSDTLDGGAGDDTYILNGGDGFDLIGDVSGTDSIVYGPGIAFGDIRPLLAGGQVYLSNQNGSEDAVVIGGWGAAPVIENFVFEDAGQISAATLLAPRWSTYFDADLGQWNTVVVSSSGSVAVTASGSANGEISGTAQADLIVASGYVISGDGDDELHGLNGADTFEGGAGADTLSGGRGNDTLLGMSGDDALHGGADNDTLNGGSGNDYLGGFSGDDVLNGGSGADTMLGGEGNDTYYVDDMADVVTELSGHGEDTVNSAVNYALTAEVEWLRLTGDDSIDGTGNTSANTLFGNTGANVLMGDAGDDALLGRMGNDTLGGGAGNDSLTGGQGNDTYRFGRGDDVDTVVDYDAMDADPAVYGATVDVVRLGGDIAHDQLWFSRSGHDLQIGVIGTEDRMTLQDWYRGAAYQVDEVYAGDGYRLLNDQVDQLVQAMAAFAPPAGGELDLPANYRPDLDPVIAVNWQAA